MLETRNAELRTKLWTAEPTRRDDGGGLDSAPARAGPCSLPPGFTGVVRARVLTFSEATIGLRPEAGVSESARRPAAEL